MINYSIIIPHKNIPKLLERCVNSIPQRKDVEIIIIDDCSNNVNELLNLEILKRDKVKLILLEKSKGAGFARNEGIKHAKGRWILFADADDFYTNFISNLFDKYAFDSHTDMVFLNAQAIDDCNVTSTLPIDLYISNYIKHKTYSEKVIRYAHWVPWTRMVKRNMIDNFNISFDEIPIGNDAMFSLKCSKISKIIAVEPDIIYNYYKPSTGSCTSHYYVINNLEARINLRYRINDFYKEVGFLYKLPIIIEYIRHKNKNYEFTRKYMQLLKKYKYSLLNDIYNTIIYYIGKILSII